MEEKYDLQKLMDAVDLVVNCLPAARGAIAAALIADGDSDNWSVVDGYREKAKAACYEKAAKILSLGPTDDIGG